MAVPGASVTLGNITGGIGVGVNNAPFSATFNLPPRPETPPAPSSTVPHQHDPDYIDRAEFHDEISKQLSSPGARVALVGLGGSGKTQIAVDYLRRVREDSPQTWALWVFAADATRFEQTFRVIAEKAKIPGRHQKEVDICELVRNWLYDSKTGKWILVLDNADNADVLLAPPEQGRTRRLIDYIPVCEHGTAIITTRNESVARRLVYRRHILEIPIMDTAHATALLERKLGTDEAEDHKDLAVALDHLPLAMAQAAAYILARRPWCSVKSYVDLLEDSRKSRTRLLQQDEHFVDRDPEASSSVLLTWQISFEHIRKTRSTAADLLGVMSFCDRQAIPEVLVNNIRRESRDGVERSHDESVRHDSEEDQLEGDEFRKDLMTLRDYFFIKHMIESSTWQMHRLIQDATQMWLTYCGETDNIRTSFLQCLDKVIPAFELGSWSQLQMLSPHIQAAVTQKPSDRDSPTSLASWASTIGRAASFMTANGMCLKAEPMQQMVVQAMISSCEENDEQTIDNYQNLRHMVQTMGRLDEAEELSNQIVARSQVLLGPGNRYDMVELQRLAEICMSKGELKEAEQRGIDMLKILKDMKTPFAEIARLQAKVIIAQALDLQGQDEESEELMIKVVEESTSMNATLETSCYAPTFVTILAVMYRGHDKWEAAEKLLRETLERMRAAGKALDMSTLDFMVFFADHYKIKKRWNKAGVLLSETLEGLKEIVGEDHLQTLTTMSSLATIHTRQERWRDARDLQQQVLIGYRKNFEEDHYEVAQARYALALTYEKQGELQVARALYETILETQGNIDSNIRTGRIEWLLVKVGMSIWRTHADDETRQLAEESLTRALEFVELPDEETYKGILLLARIHIFEKQWKEAEYMYLQRVHGTLNSLGQNHICTIDAMDSFAHGYVEQENWAEAEHWYLLVLQSSTETFGRDHLATAKAMNDIASVYCRQERWQEAEKLQRRCVECRTQKLGPDHDDTIAAVEFLEIYRDIIELVGRRTNQRDSRACVDIISHLRLTVRPPFTRIKPEKDIRSEEGARESTGLDQDMLSRRSTSGVLGLSRSVRQDTRLGKSFAKCYFLETAKLNSLD